MICSCPGGAAPETVCGDTSDNDCDGQIDCADTDCAAACAPPALYFSEYVEGTSNNKAIEIHNPSNAPFDLAAASCSVRIYSNGAPMAATTVALTGTIAAGDVHVVCNNMGNMATLLPLCDQLAGGMMMGNVNHNGNDALELVCNGTTLDVFGQIGFDPGAEWGTGLTSTADNTLRRSCTLFPDTNGADVFDPAVQWTGLATDTFAGLGVRSCPGTP
jgi:predicted extracellular nuclease